MVSLINTALYVDDNNIILYFFRFSQLDGPSCISKDLYLCMNSYILNSTVSSNIQCHTKLKLCPWICLILICVVHVQLSPVSWLFNTLHFVALYIYIYPSFLTIISYSDSFTVDNHTLSNLYWCVIHFPRSLHNFRLELFQIH